MEQFGQEEADTLGELHSVSDLRENPIDLFLPIGCEINQARFKAQCVIQVMVKRISLQDGAIVVRPMESHHANTHGGMLFAIRILHKIALWARSLCYLFHVTLDEAASPAPKWTRRGGEQTIGFAELRKREQGKILVERIAFKRTRRRSGEHGVPGNGGGEVGGAQEKGGTAGLDPCFARGIVDED